MKIFAFLDVDQTLLYNDNDINQPLLDKLKEKGITNIYLFTNMGMSDILHIGVEGAPLSRYRLIEYLTFQGFTVHGVITPADPHYYDEKNNLYPVGSAYRNLYHPSYEQILHGEKLLKNTSNIEHLTDYYWHNFLWEKASFLTRKQTEMTKGKKTVCLPQLIIIDDKRKKTVCSSREDLKQQLTDLRAGNTTYGISLDNSDETVTLNESFSDNKALMMAIAIKQLMGQLNEDIGIFYADNYQPHLDGVKEVVNAFNSHGNNNYRVILQTCPMSTNYRQAINDQSAEMYAQSIKDFYSEVYSLILLDLIKRIDDEIAALNRRKINTFFNESPKNKIALLEDLKTRFSQTNGNAVYQIIDDWKKAINRDDKTGEHLSNNQVISAHRNIFSKLLAWIIGSKTKTEKFIECLEANHSKVFTKAGFNQQ